MAGSSGGFAVRFAKDLQGQIFFAKGQGISVMEHPDVDLVGSEWRWTGQPVFNSEDLASDVYRAVEDPNQGATVKEITGDIAIADQTVRSSSPRTVIRLISAAVIRGDDHRDCSDDPITRLIRSEPVWWGLALLFKRIIVGY